MNIGDVHKVFGEASHWASILEEQLCNICMLNERVINQEKYDENNAKSIIEKYQRKTTGDLIKDLKKVLDGEVWSEKIDVIFKPALEKRNRLIHSFFIDHHDIFKNEDAIKSALQELAEIKNVIFPAADFATKTCSALTQNFQNGKA